jgi:hypothetical protein
MAACATAALLLLWLSRLGGSCCGWAVQAVGGCLRLKHHHQVHGTNLRQQCRWQSGTMQHSSQASQQLASCWHWLMTEAAYATPPDAAVQHTRLRSPQSLS